MWWEIVVFKVEKLDLILVMLFNGYEIVGILKFFFREIIFLFINWECYMGSN